MILKQNESNNVKQLAQSLFGTFFAGWINFLEVNFKEPYDQIENKMREDKQFFNHVLLVACRNRVPKDWKVEDVVEVFNYILSI